MIALADGVEAALREHARRGAPEEVCGVLGGEYGLETSRAIETVRLANVADDPRTRYRLDPAAQLDAMDDLTEQGLDVVGFYHSHPCGPAEPSATDVAEAAWRDYSYVIVSGDGGDWGVNAWRWRGDGFEEESVQ